MFTLSLRALSSTALRICLVMAFMKPSTCGVIAVDPSQGDVHAAGAFDFLGVQFTALAHGLGLLLIGALALDAPDVGDRLAFGQEVDEVLDAACVQEFHDARVRGLFAERAINDLVAGRQ